MRDIHTKYKKSSKINKAFNIPSYSQLSRLNKVKSSDLFRNVFGELLLKSEKELKTSANIKDFKDIKIINSSIFSIGKDLSPELYYEYEKSSIRISTLFSYGTKLPNKINIISAKVGKRNCIDYMLILKKIYIYLIMDILSIFGMMK